MSVSSARFLTISQPLTVPDAETDAGSRNAVSWFAALLPVLRYLLARDLPKQTEIEQLRQTGMLRENGLLVATS